MSTKAASKRRYVTGARRASPKKPTGAAQSPAIRQVALEPADANRYANVRRGSAALRDVPPFCFLAPSRTVDEALRAAVKAMGLSHPVDVVVLAWKLRKVAEGRGR